MRPVSIDEVKAELNLNNLEYEKLLKQTQPITFVPIDEPAGGGTRGRRFYFFI
jgi:hypothetical protein